MSASEFIEFLRNVVASLHRGAVRDLLVPAFDVRKLCPVDPVALVSRNPWPDGHVGYRIVARDVATVGNKMLEDAVKAIRFLGEALLRIRGFVLIVVAEVINLAEQRTDAAHLLHQPLDNAIAFPTRRWNELAVLVGGINQDRAGFHQCKSAVAIDNAGILLFGETFRKL